MIVIVVSIAAFFFGAVVFERSGFFNGLSVFLSIAFISAVVESMIERSIRFACDEKNIIHPVKEKQRN